MANGEEDDKVLAGESSPDEQTKEETAKQAEENQRIRSLVGNIYTFVRSREINETLVTFTFDHYIQEAIEDIRGTEHAVSPTNVLGRAIRDAAGRVIARRPAKLEALEKLKKEFTDMWDSAVKLAEKADKSD